MAEFAKAGRRSERTNSQRAVTEIRRHGPLWSRSRIRHFGAASDGLDRLLARTSLRARARPPLRPACRASAGDHSCAVPSACAARPPLPAISRRLSWSMAANPR